MTYTSFAVSNTYAIINYNPKTLNLADMTAIDSLEKRLEALENKVFAEKDIIDKTRSITDQLLQTKVMISSALSLRESITSLLEKMPKINEYLDPTYSVNESETELKRQYVILLYPELKETAELLHRFDDLKSMADSKAIVQISDSVGKLNELATANLALYEKSKDTTNNVIKALQTYNDITMSIRKLFANLDKSLTELEMLIHTKVKMEE